MLRYTGDFEKLKEFGFEEKSNCYSRFVAGINYNNIHPSYSESCTFIIIRKHNHQILLEYSCKIKDTEESKNSIVVNGICEDVTKLDLLCDLIKAGLVEKVVEE